MAILTKKSTGAITLNVRELCLEAAKKIVFEIASHTSRGLIVDDNDTLVKMAPYSDSYRELKAKAGLPTDADLTVSGGLLKGIRVISVEGSGSHWVATISPDANTNTSEKFLNKARSKKARAKAKARTPPRNNEIAFWHQTGAGRNPRRRFFAVAKSERERILKALRRIAGIIAKR